MPKKKSVPKSITIQTGDRSKANTPLVDFVPRPLMAAVEKDHQRVVPATARDPKLMNEISDRIGDIPTEHQLVCGDSRKLGDIANGSVHLVVTSPPYWNLKRYEENDAQLGHLDDYEGFLDELDRVDAARATNGTLHLLRWNRGSFDPIRSMRMRVVPVLLRKPYKILQEV